jgi:hypothetical protein
MIASPVATWPVALTAKFALQFRRDSHGLFDALAKCFLELGGVQLHWLLSRS